MEPNRLAAISNGPRIVIARLDASSDGMPDLRRRAIISDLARNGRVVAAQIAAALGVSDDTVRRDLDELAAAGRIRQVRGGALPAAADTPPRVVDRQELHTAGKAVVAERTANLWPP